MSSHKLQFARALPRKRIDGDSAATALPVITNTHSSDIEAQKGLETLKTHCIAASLVGAVLFTLRQLYQVQTQNRSLSILALQDPLTGCWNRRAFKEFLRTEASRTLRTGNPLTLVAIDMDGLKSINDTQGHAAGDAVLNKVVLCLQGMTRDEDRVCRIGGDEFMVLLPNCTAEQARSKIAHLRASQGIQVPEFSAGYASVPDPSVIFFNSEDLTRFLRTQADDDLYRDKVARRSGRA